MDLKRQESVTVVSSTNSYESTVVNAKIGVVWDLIRSFEWHKVFTSSHKSVKFTSGSCNEIGSLFQVDYTDGSVWVYRITEISEKDRQISYELISAKPELDYSYQQSTIKLFKVTHLNSTFLSWETDFSNDASSNVIQDNKFKKQDHFKDIKSKLEGK